MQQLDMLDEPRKLARTSDPTTSQAAADRVREFAPAHREQILAALRRFGPMTVDRIAAITRLQSQQINKRTSDMRRAGLIEPTGREFPSNSGRPEREWGVCGGKH